VSSRTLPYAQKTMTRLRSSDFEAILAFIGEAQEVGGTEPFTPELLGRLATLVPCEGTSFEEAKVAERVLLAKIESIDRGNDLYDIRTLSDEAWAAMDASPIAAHRRRTGEFGMVKWSDFFSRGQRVRHEVQPELPHVDMASVWLAPSLVHKISVVFGSLGRDFSERDRLVVNTLRPHLIALYRHAGVRRLLAAALAGLEHGSDHGGQGVLLRTQVNTLEFVSAQARALLTAYFGASGARLPPELETWIESQAKRPDRTAATPASPFMLTRAGRRLVVNAAGPGLSVLLLEEEAASVVPLTPREWDVMRCVAAGKSNAEIAGLLWIARTTVGKHLENIYAKLGVRSRTAAVAKLRPRPTDGLSLDALEREVHALHR
jgi:DNA-binding CsgD family transcriptional regulator